jgi:hypothetical protein
VAATATSPETTTALPTPFVSPIAASERSKRWAAAPAALLEAAGYVEDEFFLTGVGNVYRYGRGGRLEVKQAGVPYTTQLLVRRPADPARFSGNVVVESMHRALPFGMAFGTCWDFFTSRGDAWAQVVPGRFHITEGPQQLDPAKYAPLNLVDEGQIWDVLSQLGALLKGNGPTSPLADHGVRRAYMAGVSGTALILLTYLGDGFHERHRLPDGAPIFDGYLPHAAHGSLTYYRICSPPRGVNGVGELTPHPSEQIPLDDPRRTVQPHDVPVIQVMTEAEVWIPFSPPSVQDLMINMYNNGLPVAERLRYRRDDSDDPDDRYRLYEIAGAGHDASFAEASARMLGLAELPTLRMGRPRKPLNDFPLDLVLAAAFRNLFQWVEDGVAPPRAARIEVDEEAVQIVRDEHGNVRGGVRTPWVDVPAATYEGCNPGAALMGAKASFDRDALVALYGDADEYVKRFAARTDELVAGRWLLERDRDAIKGSAETVRELFG